MVLVQSGLALERFPGYEPGDYGANPQDQEGEDEGCGQYPFRNTWPWVIPENVEPENTGRYSKNKNGYYQRKKKTRRAEQKCIDISFF